MKLEMRMKMKMKMKTIIIIIIIIIVIVINVHGIAVANYRREFDNEAVHEDFDKMAKALGHHLGIQTITVVNCNSPLTKEVHRDNRLYGSEVLTRVLSEKQLYELINENQKPDLKTLILMKYCNYQNLSRFILTLFQNNKMHHMSNFKWLLLLIRNGKNVVFGPYDSDFITATPNKSGFVLSKSYNLKNNWIIKNYGIWDGRLTITKKEKLDMNQTLFLSYTKLTLQECDQPKYYRHKICLYMEMFKQICESVNFNFVEVTPSNNKSFGYDVDAIQRHVAVNSENRGTFVTFVRYYKMERMEWYIKKPTEELDPRFYYRPFAPGIWISIASTTILGSFTFTLLQYCDSYVIRSNRLFHWTKFIFMGLDTLLNQGCGDPEFFSIRIALFFYLFLSLFILPSYNADLTAYLSLKIISVPFQNLEEFIKNKEYKILVDDDTYLSTAIKKSNDPLFKRLNDLAERYFTPREGVEKLCNGDNYVFPTFTVYAQLLLANCDIIKIRTPIMIQMSATILGTDIIPSPFDGLINERFLKLLEAGVVQKIVELGRPDKLNSLKDSAQTVEMRQTYELLMLVGLGIGTALIILLSEKMIFTFVKLRKSK